MNLVKWIYYKTYMYVSWCVYSFIVNILYTGLFSKCIWYWPQWLKIIIFRYMLLYIHAYSPIVTHLSILLPRFGYNAEKMEIKTQRLDQMSIRFRSLFSNPILLQKCHTWYCTWGNSFASINISLLIFMPVQKLNDN